MNKWFVFGIDTYYPVGGMSDFIASFKTEAEAEACRKKHRREYDDITIENMDSYLSGEEN